MVKKLAVLIDLSGTLHIEDHPTPGAVEALNRLCAQKDRFRLKFVTNTTKETQSSLHSRLLRCGFDSVEKDDIFSSLSAAQKLISERNLRPVLFLEEEAMEDFRDVNTDNPNAVVVGLAPSKFDFEHMNHAFRLLLQPATELIGIHKGRYYRTSDGLSLGPGPFVQCLEFATAKKATIVGKPEPEFFRQALRSVQNDGNEFLPEDAIMIGDDVRDDVLGAINIGMKGILVRTGKYQPDDELQIPEQHRMCVNNFADAVNAILDGQI
ncbi:HAD-hyrolase-like domain-containing protein [Ditylenchus destructor]|nr:HAD-hyrolase-like domain-containing protein [Ditylenchus destructor]